MRKSSILLVVLALCLCASIVPAVYAQKDGALPPPTLGTYPYTYTFEGRNITVTPSAVPTGAIRFTGKATRHFKGNIEVDPTSGIVRVTNARPAGFHSVTLTATASDGATSLASFTLAVLAEKGCAPFATTNFTGTATFPTGPATNTPQYGVVADFNKDGNQDYATAVFVGNKVSVFLGDGMGGFGTEIPLAAGTNPQGITTADFNGDGNADIAAAVRNSNLVSVWPGNGNGTFGTRVDLTTTNLQPLSVVSADFNTDGKVDLVASSLGVNNLTMWLGNGDGTFAPASNIPIGGLSAFIEKTDINGDDKMDIITRQGGTGSIVVFLTGSGTGTFTVSSPFATSLVGTINDIVSGDFNNDGHVDFAASSDSAAGNNFGIFLGNGTGTFMAAAGSPFIAGSNIFGYSVGDFDGDGNQDAVASSFTTNNVNLLRGNGMGGLASVGTMSFTGPRGSNYADLNNDGRQDVVIIERSAGRIAPRLGACGVNVVESSLLNGTNGQPYNATVTASGGSPPYTFSATGLPTGLSISPGGVISGTPFTVVATYYPKIIVTDSTPGTPITTYRVIPLTIVDASANVSVGGRVTTSDGVAIANAVVTMTDTGGSVRSALTSSFGYYQFDSVQTGQTYTFAVSRKSYSFTPQMVMVNGQLNNLDFTALP